MVSGVVVVVGLELVVGDDDDDDARGVQTILPEFGSVCGCHDEGAGGVGSFGMFGLSCLPGCSGFRIDFGFCADGLV